MSIKINWTEDKIKNAKRLIEMWMNKYGCYSSECAYQCDDCTIYAPELIGDLADLLVEKEYEENEE